jgi:hypothetical protein
MISGLRHHRGRSVSLHAAAGLLAAVVLLPVAGTVHADDDCATTFEKWSKLSSARMRMQLEVVGGSQKEACIPTEATRQDLLQALAKARTACEETSWLDQTAKQTKELIDINASFISSVVLCRPDEPPRTIEAEPAAPKPAARPHPCLDVAQVNAESYVLSNRKCSGSTVLAVIERQTSSGKVECKAYTIARRLSMATPKNARPQINYECVLEQANCTKERVASMFPECDR